MQTILPRSEEHMPVWKLLQVHINIWSRNLYIDHCRNYQTTDRINEIFNGCRKETKLEKIKNNREILKIYKLASNRRRWWGDVSKNESQRSCDDESEGKCQKVNQSSMREQVTKDIIKEKEQEMTLRRRRGRNCWNQGQMERLGCQMTHY